MDHDSLPSARSERLLKAAGRYTEPKEGSFDRVRQSMRARMVTPQVFKDARDALTPAPSVQAVIWRRLSGVIRPEAASLWDGLRTRLSPSAGLQASVWQRVLSAFQPVALRTLVSRPLKLVAAFAVLLFVVRLSPVLFLAPASIAEASVIVTPSRGQVEVLIGGLWQPLTKESTLSSATMLQTQDGEATIILYDDAVIRMAPYTTVALQHLADRPKQPDGQDLDLQRGEIWLLGLVPRQFTGITVGTAQGRVVVHEGSVSIVERGADIDVGVWYRSASVARRGQQLSLVAGDRVTLASGIVPSVKKSAESQYDREWVTRNLAMDAAHQHEIAQLQQQRRAASAGALPGEGLYPVKRFAEAVDVLFTLDPETRAKKILTHANTRLSEAAALIERGSGSQAIAPLQEYRDTIAAVASGSVVAQSDVKALVEQDVAAAAAGVSAALPDDSGYALKQTVRATLAALPDSSISPDTGASELLDELTVVKRHADEGETESAKLELEKLRPFLPGSDASGSLLSDATRKEVEATLSSTVAAVESQDDDLASLPTEESTEPARPTPRERQAQEQSQQAAVVHLTDEQMDQMVVQMRNRVLEGYHSNRARQNQLQLEFRRLEGNPDQGSILRKLYHALPDDLGLYVRFEIQRVAEANKTSSAAAVECTGSGC